MVKTLDCILAIASTFGQIPLEKVWTLLFSLIYGLDSTTNVLKKERFSIQ